MSATFPSSHSVVTRRRNQTTPQCCHLVVRPEDSSAAVAVEAAAWPDQPEPVTVVTGCQRVCGAVRRPFAVHRDQIAGRAGGGGVTEAGLDPQQVRLGRTLKSRFYPWMPERGAITK